MSRVRRASLHRSTAAAIALGAITIAFGIAGCESEPAPKSARISKNYDGRFSNVVSYESFGTTAAVDCAEGKTLDVVGSNNKLTVRGRCDEVKVAGADNRITIEWVEKALTITGLNNSVTYRGGQPRVANRGSGNTIADKRTKP